MGALSTSRAVLGGGEHTLCLRLLVERRKGRQRHHQVRDGIPLEARLLEAKQVAVSLAAVQPLVWVLLNLLQK